MEYTSMGDLICDARKSKNLTQKDLADRLNITDKAVSKWERGVSYPDVNTIPKLASVLGISSEELLSLQTQQISSRSINMTIGQKASQTVNLVLKAVGVAMGIATLVLSIMGNLESHTAITMLAIGVTCMGISQFRV